MDKNLIVQAYLKGDDLPNNISIDEFENNPELMFLAILSSGDKRLYDLCSNNVKKDFFFVNMLIRKFSDDKEFVEQVGDYYLANYNKEELNERIKILLLLIKTLDRRDNNIELFKYRVPLSAIYQTDMVSIADVIEEEPDKFGLGFNIIEETYDHDKDILDYYANQMVTSVFPLNIARLEDRLHSHNFKPENIINTPPIAFIVSYVKNYDDALAAYIALHPESFEGLANSFLAVKQNWLPYNDELLSLKVNGFLDYMKPNEQWEPEDIIALVYITSKYNVKEEFLNYAESDVSELFDRCGEHMEFLHPELKDKTIYEQVDSLFTTKKKKKFLLEAEKTFKAIWKTNTINEAREVINEYMDSYLSESKEGQIIALPKK